MDIETVGSAGEATEKLDTSSYDVVVADYSMDGIALLKKLRTRDPLIPFILLIDGDYEAVVVEAIKGGAEYCFKGKDGSVIFSDLAHRIRAAVGDRRVWASLLELDERYWSLLLSLRGMAFTATLDFVPTSIYGDVEGITGYTEEEIFSCDPRWDQIIHPDDLSRLKPEMEVARSARTHVSENEYRIIRKDGDVRWVHELVQIVCEGPGSLVKVEGVLYDVTARKRAEAALEDSDIRYRQLVDLLPLTVFELDSTGRITFSNQKGLEAFGYSTEDLRQGLTIFDAIVTVDPDELEEGFRLALNGCSSDYDILMTRKDGSTFPAIIKTVPIIRDGRPSGMRGVIVDITERMEMEEALKAGERFYQALIDADRAIFDEEGELSEYQSVGQDITERKLAEDVLQRAHGELEAKNAGMERFAYTVYHDLRSPLATIQGFLGFLKEDVENRDEERIGTDIEMMTEAVEKMDSLLRDTLRLSQIGRVANPPEDVPFGEIVKDSFASVSELARSRGVEITVAEGWPVVHVDRMRISEVLVNLIENGIKYMGDQPDPQIEVGWRKDGEVFVFFVRDNGIGVDPGQQEKVFELFYKADPGSEGTGAGLPIVESIIEVHGGRIWIESVEGEGSTFCFTLPVVGD